MPAHQLRVVLVGASSLLGKELSEEMAESALGTAEILLFDTDAVDGQMTTVGEEASFIRRVTAGSFERADFAFFAGSPEQTREHWKSARQAGAMVVDLTYALAGESEVLVWSPWVAPLHAGRPGLPEGVGARRPDLQTAAVVPAHPVATMLALLAARITDKISKPTTLAATVLQPASELGQAGLDELHQQTVSLLSFKDLPQETFDAQTAFNVLAQFGGDAATGLAERRSTILSHYAALAGDRLPDLALQVLQVPVFHGYTSSIFLQLGAPVRAAEISGALAGGRIELPTDPESPSNLSAAGRSEILISVEAVGSAEESTSFWLCAAADNLKLAAANAIDCALGMRSLRPQGKVQ